MISQWYFSIIIENIKKILVRNYSSSAKCSKSYSRRGPPWKILFFGTDEFALRSLKPLCAKLRTGTLIDSLGVVSKAGSIVQKFGKSEELPSFCWPLSVSEIKSAYDIGMVVSFGKLIPKEIIEVLPLGCINVHASMLPRWRGAAPIVHSVMNGDTETGITIMKIHPYRFDVGEIVHQYRVPITLDETSIQLETKLAICGAHLLMECLRDLPRCLDKATPQPSSGVTYAPKIKQILSAIRWDEMPARAIYNLHRALNHMYPPMTMWHGAKVKLTDLRIEDNSPTNIQSEQIVSSGESDLQKSALNFLSGIEEQRKTTTQNNNRNVSAAGLIYFSRRNKELKVLCKDGNFIIVNKLKIGGKSLSSMDFYNGFLAKMPKDKWRFINCTVDSNEIV